jgi:hypothetical protein
MAEPIVRSFVIDTTESEQNLKELNVQINATSGAIDNTAQSFDNVATAEQEVVTSSKSLKAQLRDLQAQLANTEPDSAKYRELAAAAGELKDKISDAAEAVGTQAGGAFERVGGSLGLVTSRIANLDFQGAAEGAKQLAANIGQVKPGDIAKGIQGIGSAFASVGKALLTNPIFLVGAAIAAAIVYADELLSLIDGVTDAETEALDVQKERAALAKEQVDAIGAQEESLKRQGLTEKEITDLKLKALDTAILEQKVVVETSKTQAKAQIDAAQRNFDYLKGFLDFVTLPQKKLVEFFLNFYNGAVDLINKLGFSIEKVDVTSIVSNFDKVNETIAKQLFDPEETKKQGEATIKEAEKTLISLTNQRDGILNAQAAKEKAARDKANADAKTAQEKANADRLKAEQEVSDLVNQLYEENLKEFEDAEKAKTQAALQEAEKRRKAVEEYYNQLAAFQDASYEASLTTQEKEELAVTQKYEKLFAAADAAGISTVELQKQLAAELLAIQNKSSDDEVKVKQITAQKGLELANNALQVLQAFSDASTKNGERDARKKFRTDKALAIGAATVQTASAVTGALTAGGNPIKLATGQQFIEAGIAAALGLAQIIKIKNSQFGSTGGNNTNTTTPSVADTGGGGSQPAQFNPLTNLFQDRPEQITPRAYVLAGDVASAAEVRENVADLARIG